MKEISKISKIFHCECGSTNKFEFETDFDIHDIVITAKCQNCGRDYTVDLNSFFRKRYHPTVISPVPYQNEYMVGEYNNQNQSMITPSYTPQENPYGNNDQTMQNEQTMQNLNGMDMFSSPESITQAMQGNPSQPDNQEQKSEYAGLLNLHEVEESYQNEIQKIINDDVYEPFPVESQTIVQQENSIPPNNAINSDNLLNIQTRQIKQNGDDEEIREEDYSDLFGNM